jgi:hypothetical protein
MQAGRKEGEERKVKAETKMKEGKDNTTRTKEWKEGRKEGPHSKWRLIHTMPPEGKEPSRRPQ